MATSHLSELCKKNDFDALCAYLVQSTTLQDESEQAAATSSSGGGPKYDPMQVKNAGERQDDEGRTALHWAVAVGASNIASQLASQPYHMNPVTIDVDLVTPLMSACAANVSFDAFYAMLKAAEFNLQAGNAVVPGLEEESEGEADDQPTPAAAGGEGEKKEEDGKKKEKKEPLSVKEQVKFFVNLKDKLGNTALIAASSRGNGRLVTLLSSAEGGADVFAQNKRGQTALHRAVARGNVEVVETLIQAAKGTTTQSGMARHRALLNTKDREGNTALHYASMENNQELGEMLIRAGANRDAKNNDGKEFWQM